MNKKEAYQIVLEDLKKCRMFCGEYDATNGHTEFMYGICTVMENIACVAGDETFGDIFLQNMTASETKS